MGRLGKEVSGLVFCVIGLLGLCVSCGIPHWRVTTYIGANIVSGQIVWDGLWMNCVMQSTGQMQCRLIESVLSLTQDLQAGRALTAIAIVVTFAGIVLIFVGGKCTSCLKNDASMHKVVILAGIICIVGAVIHLIPVTWSAAVTIADFVSPLTITTQKRELGTAIYVGWASVLLLLLGGILLCTSCPRQENLYAVQNGHPPPPGYPYTGPYVPAKAYTYSGPYTASGTYAPVRSYPPSEIYAPRKPYSTGQYL